MRIAPRSKTFACDVSVSMISHHCQETRSRSSNVQERGHGPRIASRRCLADRRPGRRLAARAALGADLGPIDARAADALRATSVPAVLNNSPDVPRAFSVWPTEPGRLGGHSPPRSATAAAPRPHLARDWSTRSSSTTTRAAASCSSSTMTSPARVPTWSIASMPPACCRRTCRSRTPLTRHPPGPT